MLTWATLIPMNQKRSSRKAFRRPTGTRDLYPEDLLRRRYIVEAWRAASLRHGFDEIDGPTFEHADLYTVKSGEGILSELFSFTREGGDDLYALRPEFTPTLARLYAARANSLPTPTRWFCVPSFFRAERPQRGRLREFMQWNADVIGDDSPSADADIIACIADLLASLGLSPDDVQIRLSHREAIAQAIIRHGGVQDDGTQDGGNIAQALTLLDKRSKLDENAVRERARDIGFALDTFDRAMADEGLGDSAGMLMKVRRSLDTRSLTTWCVIDPSIVRGLAYYTGTVFEVIAQGERAVAGGGRYDNLIELFNGPHTPACGVGMGDVVLANLLEDTTLMPEGVALCDAVESMVRAQRLRPDVFVVPNGDDECEALVPSLVASLRMGVCAEGFEGKPWDAGRYRIRPMHARVTSKSTRNLKKLIADAEKQRARFCAIIHGSDKVQLKNLDTREDLPSATGDWSCNPASDVYIAQGVISALNKNSHHV